MRRVPPQGRTREYIANRQTISAETLKGATFETFVGSDYATSHSVGMRRPGYAWTETPLWECVVSLFAPWASGLRMEAMASDFALQNRTASPMLGDRSLTRGLKERVYLGTVSQLRSYMNLLDSDVTSGCRLEV
jgi:hypothetical protein